MSLADPAELRIVLAGSVGSSRLTLEAFIRHDVNVVGVLESRPTDTGKVCDYAPLNDLAAAANIPCVGFQNINSAETIATVRAWNPDLLFVVGLSQLVKSELLAVPRRACVGFHPTWLPRGRGRAPIAWLTLDGHPGAATFFVMEEGADSGPILVQEPFSVSVDDYASDVARASSDALRRALDRWLPKLLTGEWNPITQDETDATYFGKRAPEDGLIDWERPAREIHALIRAASHPHPGAYTYVTQNKLVVWRAELERQVSFRGVPGRILVIDDSRGALVQTGDGLLWLTATEWADQSSQVVGSQRIRVGQRLGYVVDDELFRLRERVMELENRLSELESRNASIDPYGDRLRKSA